MSNLPLPLLVSNLCALASTLTAKLAAVLLLLASNFDRIAHRKLAVFCLYLRQIYAAYGN
ncbi:hypothetical protein CAMRE0001_1348 [Campylobacter rectus RM3267]|uniref:Uncharacterized protein n=1 Tax=Campylobacter rectus RM3267 TaxID=553218 RepID=B9D034_CAMRE|nr:hypothetical protein CAMRE0001_1348 [Campylobacter rectus RM3267]